jgi:hypothetical protein
MTTHASEITPTTEWAAQLGRRVAERRAKLAAEREAEAQVDANREQIPPEILRERFASVAARLVEFVECFADAGGLPVEGLSSAPTVIELAAGGGSERLRVQLEDDALLVAMRGRSRAESRYVDITADSFAVDEVARAIVEPWLRWLSAMEDARHA